MSDRFVILLLALAFVVAIGSAWQLDSGVGWCAGTEIVFLLPGNRSDLDTSMLFEGAVTAADDLGATIPYTKWAGWDTSIMVDQLRAAVDLAPDAIIVSGYAGDTALLSGIDDAEIAGIHVSSFGPPLPVAQERWGQRGFGSIGMDIYQIGYDLARESALRAKLKLTDKAFVWGELDTPALADRTRGILDGLRDAGIATVYADVGVTKLELDKAPARFVNILAANPGVKLVITDHGALSGWHEQMLRAAFVSNTTMYVAGVDLSYRLAQSLKSGWTDLTVDDLSWMQGYQSVLQVCASARYKQPGQRIELRPLLLDITSDALPREYFLTGWHDG